MMKNSKCFTLMLLAALSAATQAATLDEFNDATNSWTGFNSISGQTEAGGVLSGNVTGSDPHFQRLFTPYVETSANSYAHVRMKSASTLSGPVQLFWDVTSSFNGPNSATVAGVHNGSFQDYVFNLGAVSAWGDGLARGFRLDPMNSGTGAFELDYIRLSSSATDSYAYGVDNFSDGSFSTWARSSAMGSPTESGGIFSGTATGTGDAFMSRDIIDVDGSIANLVRVGLKATGSTTAAQIFWANEDGSYAGARSETFNITADGTMRTYEIDLSANANWNGKTIDGFRIDPVTVAGDSYEIDFIEIVSIPEPSSALLGLFGSLLLLCRRRSKTAHRP